MPSEDGLMPIREVSRLTGVNPVTLRAWERRYGLIVPRRTEKGHRLYDAGHVQRVRQILAWLERGIAVGQVRGLLERNVAPAQAPGDEWQTLRQSLVECMSSLNERRLDQLVNQAMALYPASTVCEQLFQPLLEQLPAHGPGASLPTVFFLSWLRSKLGVRVYHNNRQLGGPPALLVNASRLPFDPHLWLCAWLLSDSGCAVEVFDWPVPARDLGIALGQLQPRALFMSLNAAVNLREVQRSLATVEVPKVLFGSAIPLYADGLLAETGLHLCTTPLQASRLLNVSSFTE